MPGANRPYTDLDANQVLTQSFDEENDRLRVDATVTASISTLEISAEESDIAIKDRLSDNLLKINNDGSIDANVILSASGGDNIAISDGTNTLQVNSDGSINTNVVVSASEGDNIAISDGTNSLAVNPDGSVNVVVGSASVPVDYDEGEVQYISPTVETYVYKKNGASVKTVTITYTDSSKDYISNWTIL